MSRLIRRERAYASVGTRCDVCKGEGLVELAPMNDGTGRWGCPVCRHAAHVKVTPLAPAKPFDRAEAGDDWPLALVPQEPEEGEP